MIPPRFSKFRKNGFSLVVTVSMLVVLTVIAVGLLSLSTVSIKSVRLSSADELARSNARMALMMAIGELQAMTGPDTRVTAPASLLNNSNPMALGVWRSWEGTNHQSNGLPTQPDYGSKQISASSNDGRFMGWLVSSATAAENVGIDDVSGLIQTNADDSDIDVPLLASGSLPDTDSRQVHVVPNKSDRDGDGLPDGRYAWWVSGENQKARLGQPYEARNNGPAGLSEKGKSHSIPNPEAFGMTAMVNDQEPHNPAMAASRPGRKAATRQSMALVEADNAVEPELRFHDFSTSATGLLTNTATGGWRKDMSLLTENWSKIYVRYPGRRLPLFRFSPNAGDTSQVPKPNFVDYDPTQSNLYPWSESSLILGFKQPCTYHSASASWESLRSYAIAYKDFRDSGSGPYSSFKWSKISKQSANAILNSELYIHKHRLRLHPQIARFQFIVYANAIEDPNRMGQNPRRYQLRLKYVPVFTLWNPYNLTLQHRISGTLNGGQGSGTHTRFLGFGFRRGVPGVMAMESASQYPNPASVPNSRYRLLTNGNFQTLDWPSNYANPYDNNLVENTSKFGGGNVWHDLRTWGCWLPEGTLSFKPGEVKVYSPAFRDFGYGFGGGCFRLQEGFDAVTLAGYDSTRGMPGNLTADRRYWFLFRNDRYTQPYRDRAPGYGFSLSWGDGSSHFGGTAQHPSGIGDEYHNITALTSGPDGERYWPNDDIDEIQYSVGELIGRWVPLYSASFGPRMTMGIGSGTDQNRPTKGVVQNDALASMVLSDPGSGDAKDHPVNNTYDFAYHSLPGNSTLTPNQTDSAGYIATGSQIGDGISRLIMSEIPLRPMASLIELQSWNPRGHNPYPPMAMNLIGNSDASPLLPKDAVLPRRLTPNSVQNNLVHDDAYCANHLLFDDWFCSSIAPLPYDFGRSIDKNISTVYREFLSGDLQLTNRAYQPIPADRGLSDDQINDLVSEVTNNPQGDAWLKIASRLEVEGMFNVNSTSVDAWKALLGHAKSFDQIAMHGENSVIAADTTDKHAVTRGSIATDVEAGAAPGFGAQFANASEYTGHRGLTDDQIEELAEKIVEQVRLRGPFLSLSEFVNRQLSNNTDLALAGAIQSALNNMTDDPMATLRDPNNRLSDDTMDPNDLRIRTVDYEFEEAAEGSSAYGAPGWIRQADILRPIAPVLSVRDDTFTIRAYGDALDANGNVEARAWCEAVVKRTREYSDSTVEADAIDPASDPTNARFGRKYKMISFRWLNASEV
ncbi:MAG: type IV pilus modification PilV family protein [Luteolibacter sp.]